ncbi:hypothetical protein [Paraburkholderia sp. JHI869]|uniref:hypothetical protein n=1 Tax=Paraburkholderia sp. JHI869 TaxID=3112959 RepID=UPI00316D124D
MRVQVTGAGGFVGSALVGQYPGAMSDDARVTSLAGDFSEPQTLERVLANPIDFGLCQLTQSHRSIRCQGGVLELPSKAIIHDSCSMSQRCKG